MARSLRTRVRIVVVFVVLALVAGGAAANEAQVRALVERELAVLGKVAELKKVFAADALVIAYASAMTGALEQADPAFDSAEVTRERPKLDALVHGTAADVTWLAADFTEPYTVVVDCRNRCERKRALRATQLVVNGQVVAAHFADPVIPKGETLEHLTLPRPTAPGPLTALLTDPTALAAALHDHPGVVVYGTEKSERATGTAAARKLLGTWKKLKLEVAGKPSEVRTKTWGYAAASVDWVRKPGVRVPMTASVFAIATGPDTWKVVAVHYSAPFQRTMYH